MPDREVVELLSRLVEIDSVNPDLIAGGAGESEIARFVAEWLERAGLDVDMWDTRAGRPNVVGIARGRGGGRSLLLNAHTDTVGVAGMDDAHVARVDGDRMYGRGAYDMKGGLSAIMLAGAAAANAGLAGDVLVTAVVDEEVASIGAEALVDRYDADAAIVTEPTELEVAVAHKGFVGFEIETAGVAAHGSRPHLGVDAIRKMGPVLQRLDALDRQLQGGEPHPLVGPPSLHASLIEGGQEYSSYPARCLLTAERRTIPGEDREQVERDLRNLAGDDGEFRRTLSREPFEVGAAEEIVRLVSDRAGKQPSGVSFWADSGILAGAGIPTVLYGPLGDGAHAVVEWVDLPSVERVRDVLVSVAEAFCSDRPRL